MMNQTNPEDSERQYLSDLETATALSLETKAMEDIKRQHGTYHPETQGAGVSSSISLQEYQKILKQRESSYNRRNSSSQYEARKISIAPSNLATFNSKSVDDTDQPDLISFTSPTSGSGGGNNINNNNATPSNFEQLIDQVQKLSLQIGTKPNPYNTNSNPVDMQLVPYQQQPQQQKIPLTPANLNQLYSMNNRPYVLPGMQPANAPSLNYGTYPTTMPVSNNYTIMTGYQPYGNQIATSYNNIYRSKSEPEQPTAKQMHTSTPIPPPPSTSTPKTSLSTSASYSNVQLRRSNITNFDDNLIDLGNDDHDLNDSRVSVLEAFDPLICRADEADETSSEYYSEYDPFDYLYSEKTEYSDPLYEAVNKSDKLPPAPVTQWKFEESTISSVPPPLPPRNSNEAAENYVTRQKLTTKLYQSIITQKLYDPELMSFYNMVLKVRQKYKYNDYTTNPGYVIASELPTYYSNSTSIKLVVYPSSECFVRPVVSNGEKKPIQGYETPIVFTCDISSTVEHVLMHCICTLEGQINGGNEDFMLKPIGVLEWLRPSSKLSQLETVHNSIKLEKDVQLGLCPRSMVTIMSIGRTQKDDIRDSEIKIEDVLPNEFQSTINYDSLMIILETIEAEIDRLESSATDGGLSCSGVIQGVKAICSLLGYIETLEISESVQNLKNVCNNSDSYFGSKMEVLSECGDYAEVKLRSRTLPEQIKVCCNAIRNAVKQLLNMYSQVFRVNFMVNIKDYNLTTRSLASVTQSVIVHLTCLYRLPPYWKYDDYLLGTQIYHGTRYIGDAKVAQCLVENLGSYPRLKFKSWLNFENIPVCVLPRESRLVFVLYGCINEPNDNNSNEIRDGQHQQTKTELGWFSIQFFDFDAVMIQGSYLLPLWPPTTDKYLGPAPGKGTHPNCNDYPVLGIEIPDFGGQIKFPETPTTSTAPRLDFNSLDINLQQELIDTAQQGYQNAADQREVLWEKRYYLQTFPHALPKVLHAAHSWDFASLVDLHALIRSWNPLSPIQALELLLPRYPDLRVRTCAVEWFSAISNDQLVDYLPQLVQALKHETYEASALSYFLLARSLESPRVAHYLYWLLVQNLPGDSPQNSSMELSQTNIDEMLIAQSRYHRRNQLLLRALLATCGEKLSSRFLTQNIMCKNLADIAQIVKSTKETHRQKILNQKLEIINQQLNEQSTSLPLGPGQEVNGVNCRTSSYFNSNTLPLKINFLGTDKEIIPAIFKCGDDLQQDMLTLQLVRIMDKLWLREGLDLKIVTFNCIPTGYKKGIIEMVSDAETLRKIQVEWGLTGSFKDKPIAEWLARQNPSNLEYHRAVDNFTVSCAGYSVATYVLGICDRHNDNIMLKTSGHLFHIDFGKFLGDAQMFGNFKRDRTPFVLTSDMAYVINGGEKPSTKFHHFVDICCQAFNIVRKHGDFLLHMLALMATSGIPGVTADSVNYVRKALLPGQSNPEAAASFAKMIHISLKSWFTQVNFFLHNIAQMRFSNEEGNDELLSFVPRTYTLVQDGRLKSVNVHGYQKRYELEKYYTYILKVTRQNQPDPSYLFRAYKEFLEFHQKLCLHFPLAKLHSLQSGLHVGRSHIKTVAERRLPEIQRFLLSLFNSADEIAHSDLVYTFFHPLLRDQQEANINIKKVKEIKNVPSNERDCGQIKFSLQYLRGALTVMIHHARSLPLTANGQEPNTYVKCYLKPDLLKQTKRKTKVVKKSCFPSFMETLEYRMPLEIIQSRTLEITIWSHDSLQENEFLGGVRLVLGESNLREEIIQWCNLCYLPRS